MSTTFAFSPEPSPLSVQAFSLPFRALAVLLVGGCGYWMWVLQEKGLLTGTKSAQIATENIASSPLKNGSFFGLSTQQGWIIAALALLVYTLIWILKSRTTLDAQRIRQSWIWDKELLLNDLAYVRIIRIPGLDWLIAPRLYARTMLGKFNVFYASDPQMIAQWQRLQTELSQFRRL